MLCSVSVNDNEDDEYEYDDDSESISDPLDSSVSTLHRHPQTPLSPPDIGHDRPSEAERDPMGSMNSMSLNEQNVDSFPTETDEEPQNERTAPNEQDEAQSPTPNTIKTEMAKEQQLYAQQVTAQKVTSSDDHGVALLVFFKINL